MELPHNDAYYVAFGKYTYLSQELTKARDALRKHVALFGDNLKDAVFPERGDSYDSLDVESWKAAFARLCLHADRLTELARDADAYARLCGAPPVKLNSKPAPRE